MLSWQFCTAKPYWKHKDYAKTKALVYGPFIHLTHIAEMIINLGV